LDPFSFCGKSERREDDFRGRLGAGRRFPACIGFRGGWTGDFGNGGDIVNSGGGEDSRHVDDDGGGF
jgi:hypothetical protein